MNPAQIASVQHLDSPCLVLAGARSGKTRWITHKIARLLQPGPGADLRPAEIGAITFTNKAAAEMRERVKSLIGPRAAGKLLVCTFHSLGSSCCAKMVRPWASSRRSRSWTATT